MSAQPAVEGMAMATEFEPSRGDMMGPTGAPQKWASLANVRTGLVLFAGVILIGFVTWGVFPRSTDAGSDHRTAASVAMAVQNAPQPEPAGTPTEAALVVPAEEAAAPVAAAPVDALRISSQSWRRGGLGSNAMVTLTLRNGNDYAVKDIEITCAFSRRDGSHLTDRTRTIPDTVKMRSWRTFARLHVGFVNVNADKAKCSLVAANRI
jgi:hypothetical protein